MVFLHFSMVDYDGQMEYSYSIRSIFFQISLHAYLRLFFANISRSIKFTISPIKFSINIYQKAISVQQDRPYLQYSRCSGDRIAMVRCRGSHALGEKIQELF
jgi:hypothetical protein